MAPVGYISCPGCGRLFREASPAEMAVLEDHDCSWSDNHLDWKIGEWYRAHPEDIPT